MASLTIRNLDDDLKRRLRLRAAEAGHSMEEEVRVILRRAVRAGPDPRQRDLGTAIRARFAPLGGADLPPVPRGAGRDGPLFGAADDPGA